MQTLPDVDIHCVMSLMLSTQNNSANDFGLRHSCLGRDTNRQIQIH